MKTSNIFIILVLLALAAGFLFFRDGLAPSDDSTATPIPRQTQEGTGEAARSFYTEYSEENLGVALENGRAVLFFAAAWCPTCQALEKEILEKGEQGLPDDVTILKIDYDTARELRNDYFVTTQHTLVILSSEGSETGRFIGGGFETLLSQLSAAS